MHDLAAGDGRLVSSKAKGSTVKRILFCGYVFLLLSVWAAGETIQAGFGPSIVGGKSHQGEEITTDLPLDRMMTNIASEIDGAGMCVSTSQEQAGDYQGVPGIKGFRNWCAKYPGGSYPSKVEQQITQYYREKGMPEPAYLQYTGPDPEQLLDLIDKTGRVACIAYGYSPRYGSAINHMVYLAKASGPNACVVDNNLFGGIRDEESRRYEWMSRAELITRMKTQADRFRRPIRSDAWIFVWIEPPPPSPPSN